MRVVHPKRWATDMTAAVGRLTLQSVNAVGHLMIMLAQVCRALVRDPQRRRTIVMQLYHIGFLSLPVVMITGIATGLVLAVQAYYTLSKVSGETMAGAMVNFTMVTELGPVLTGLMLAGRVGSSIAAELGAMKVTEQIDALRVMGTDPIAYLVAPRFLACVLLGPVLTVVCIVFAIFAAEQLCVVVWDIDQGAYWAKHREYVNTWDIGSGLAKSVFFGGIISLVACRKGLKTEGGASGVGTACTEGVVTASVLILVSDFFLTLVSQNLALRFGFSW